MIKEIQAKSILIYNKHPSSWFGVHYYLNIYRGCTHGCIYCDTRSECYKVENFDKDISVKTNAIDLLQKELAKKRVKNTIGFGSTSDPYIPLELKYELTRKALMLVRDYRHPLFILTKSNLIVRDLDLISEINEQNYACIAFTITTADDKLASIIEPHAPAPSKRFEAISILKSMGIKCGIVIMPMLPFITDSKENLTQIIDNAAKSKVDFIYPSFGVTLRDRQRDYFYNHISDNLRQKYINKYHNYYNCWVPNYKELKHHFETLCQKYQINYQMPSYDKENASIQFNLFD